MPIVADGGYWNSNISELQRALNDLGADPPLEVNGVISNTTIHRLQVAANALGASPPLREDGGMGNDAIRELQIAVGLLQEGGVTPEDPGAPYVDLNMRELDGGTQFKQNAKIQFTHDAGAPTGGTLGWVIDYADYGTVTFQWDDDAAAVQAACDSEFGSGNMTVSGSGTLSDATPDLIIEFTGDFADGRVWDDFGWTFDNNLTYSGGGTDTFFATVQNGFACQTVWPDVQGNVDAIIDENDGSADENGFLIREDEHGTVLIATYDSDSRMTCPVDFTQFAEGWTVYSLRKVGDDAPDDGSEMCPDTFGPGVDDYYNDAYCYGMRSDSNGFEVFVGSEWTAGGVLHIQIGAPFDDVADLSFDPAPTVADFIAAVEAITGADTLTGSQSDEVLLENAPEQTFTWAGALTGAGPTVTFDVSDLVQPEGPGISIGDRESSFFYDTITGQYQYLAPQRGDVVLRTQVFDPVAGTLCHYDGPVMGAQTERLSAEDSRIFSTYFAGGVMLANYPGGGYCMPGPYVRFLAYPTAHTEAQRLFVRTMLRDSVAGTGYAFTLRDEVAVGSVAGHVNYPPPAAGGMMVEITTLAGDVVQSQEVDDNGDGVDYSFPFVPVGTYLVRASDYGNDVTWYAGVSSEEAATPIEVTNGGALTGIDIEVIT